MPKVWSESLKTKWPHSEFEPIFRADSRRADFPVLITMVRHEFK